MKETLLVVKHILSTSIFFLRALERKIPPFLQVCFSSHTSCSYSRAGSPSFSLRLPWDSTLARGELLAGEGFVRSFKVIKINSPKFFSEMSVILYIYSVSPYIYQRACILVYFLSIIPLETELRPPPCPKMVSVQQQTVLRQGARGKLFTLPVGK